MFPGGPCCLFAIAYLFARTTSRLHCLRFPHPPLTDAFGPVPYFPRRQNSPKKRHPKNDWFLIKKSLKNHTFGSSERLPPLSGVLPTNNSTRPPIRKPQPIHSDFFFLLAAFAIAFFWEDCTCMHCIANQTGFRGSVVAWLVVLAKRWLASTARALPPLSLSCTTASQAGFRGSLWLGSPRW